MAKAPKQQHDIIGQTIKTVRAMTEKEIEAEGWEPGYGVPVLIELMNGMKIYPSCDEEGNGPGALFGTAPDGASVYVMPANV